MRYLMSIEESKKLKKYLCFSAWLLVKSELIFHIVFFCGSGLLSSKNEGGLLSWKKVSPHQINETQKSLLTLNFIKKNYEIKIEKLITSISRIPTAFFPVLALIAEILDHFISIFFFKADCSWRISHASFLVAK